MLSSGPRGSQRFVVFFSYKISNLFRVYVCRAGAPGLRRSSFVDSGVREESVGATHRQIDDEIELEIGIQGSH